MTERYGAVDAFEWADPARGRGEPAPSIDPDTYLADLLAVEADRGRTGPTVGTDRGPGPALVAAAACLIALGWLLSSFDGERATRIATDPAWAPGETPPTGERLGPPPAQSSAVAPLIDPEDAAWDAVTPWVIGDGSRGRYRSKNFQPEVQFLVTDGWGRPDRATEVPDGLAPLVRLDRPPPEGLYLARHKDDAGTDDWLARMQDHPAIVVGSVEPAELGGHDAIEVRFEVIGPMSYVRLTEQYERRLETGQAGVAIVADVEGDIVSALLLAETSADLPTIEAAAEPIIGSIHWRDHCHQS